MSCLMNQSSLMQSARAHTHTVSSVSAPVALPLRAVFNLIKNHYHYRSKAESGKGEGDQKMSKAT